ncbi:MAG TPA: peptidoglycan-binding protein [Candidatus Magasanikbacteria bacterium]|nr:peptidoglycan-binding protein [Candidatus Magasanikbacteria bacterium]
MFNRLRRQFYVRHCLVWAGFFIVGIFSTFAVPSQVHAVGSLFAVSPVTSSYDNLAGASNARWTFTATTSEDLVAGDVVQFKLPLIDQGFPFLVTSPTIVSATGISLYSSASSTVGTNLLTNSSFEDGPTGWSTNGSGTISPTTTAVFDGAAALYLLGGNPAEGAFAMFDQSNTVLTNTQYTFSLYAKGITAGNHIYIGLSAARGDCEEGQEYKYNFVSQSWSCVTSNQPDLNTNFYVPALTTDFARYSVTFNSHASLDALNVSVFSMNNEDFVVDALQLEQGAASSTYNVGVIPPQIGVLGRQQDQSNGAMVYGLVTSTLGAGTFSVTIGGVTNASKQLALLSNLQFSIKAGTPADSNTPWGSLSSTKFNQTATASLVRSGGALISSSHSAITASSYATSTTGVNYTFKFTPTSSLPIGSKIVIQVPSEYDITGASVGEQIISSDESVPKIAAGAITTSTDYSTKKIILTTSNGATAAGSNLTVIVGGMTNPATVGVYRPFFIYTTNANGGLIDGSVFGNESSEFNGPPPVDTVHIGGTNNVTVSVYLNDENGVPQLLSGEALGMVKVVMGCPDKQFFVGTRYLNASSTVTFTNLLDCNYMVGVEPADGVKSMGFFEAALPPAFKQVNVVNGASVSTSMVYGKPDSFVTLRLTGAPSNYSGTVEVQAFNSTFESWSPVFTDTNYNSVGFNASGIGYARLPVKSGMNWKFNVMSQAIQNNGTKYWPPTLSSVYISTSTNIGDFAYVTADKDLVVTLQDTNSVSLTDACVGVKQSGGGLFMQAQSMVCQPNLGSTYAFKAPAGAVTIEVNRPGQGKGLEFPVSINSSGTTTKTIKLAAPTTFISVSVVDGSGTAIKGAPVFAQGSNGFAQGMTSASGNVSLYLPAGTYQLNGHAPGFGQLNTWTETSGTANDGTVVVPGSGSVSATATVSIGNLRTISGRIFTDVNSNNAYNDGVDTPISGAKVGARGTGNTSGGGGAETGTDGTYTIYVPAGTYQIGAWVENGGGMSPIDVSVSSANATGQNWALKAVGYLQITIQNSSNLSPLFAGVFNPDNGRGNGTDSWTTSGTSKIAILTLPAGTYKAHVGSPAVGPIVENQSVTITAGETASLSANAQASVELVDVSGNVMVGESGANGAVVWASRVSGPGFYSTTASSSGGYVLRVPKDRSYTIGVKGTGYLSDQGDVQVSVTSSLVRNFTLTQTSLTISGIVSSGGTGLQNAWVSAKKTIEGNDVWIGVPTDQSGAYSLGVDANTTWTVYAEGPCYFRSAGTSVAVTTTSRTSNISLTANDRCTLATPDINSISDVSGGQIMTDKMTLDIPANALGTSQDNVSVSVSTADLVYDSVNATPLANSVVSVEATNSSGSSITSLNNKVTLSVSYNEADLPIGFSESNLQFGYWDSNSGQWEPVAATVDTVNNLITAQVDHFTDFGPILPGVPATIQNLVSTASTSSQIDLSWDVDPVADYYMIYSTTTASFDGVFYSSDLLATTTALTYSATGLVSSTKYYFEVAGYNENGEGPNSATASSTTSAAELPSAPSGLTATAASVSQINLSWSAVSGATSYNIYRSTDSYMTAIATTSAVSYSNTGLSAATSYSYKVSAVNATGEGEKSGAVSATTNSASSGGGGGGGSSDTTPPTNTSVVINSNATTTNSLAITLTLGATDAVYMMIANDSAFTNASWVNYATSYVWNLVSGNGLKTVYVKFKDSAGNISTAISDSIQLTGTSTVVAPTTTANLISPTLRSGYVFKVKLKFGDKGEEVRQLQVVLKELGYIKNAKTNAIFNALTKKALLTYQRANKIRATGILDDATRLKLNGKKFDAVATTTPVEAPKKYKFTKFLSVGSTGVEVRNLQEVLKALGYFSVNLTEYFGQVTKAAVIKFQQDRKISNAPGWVGPATRDALNNL